MLSHVCFLRALRLWGAAAGVVACGLLCGSAVRAQTSTLYDGASNLTPDQSPWNWAYAQSPITPDVRGTAGGGATSLNTTALSALSAGYFRTTPFTLDNAAGYDVAFDLQVASEAHDNPNRAGCDVIVLGNDSKGVELAFWTDTVWAQTNAFTHATGTESASYDTTAAQTHYNLHVQANTYTLTANTTLLLSGSLHTYPALPGTPYNQTNFLFIGDDTTSASGSFSLARVAAAVPEPGCMAWLASLGITGMAFLRRDNRRK